MSTIQQYVAAGVAKRFGLAFLCTLAFCAVGLPAEAQQRPDGSVYSRFGVGELSAPTSSQIQAMGGGAVALSNYNYLNLSNPATWADQRVTRLAAGVQFQGVEIENAAGEQSRLNSSLLNAFSFSFPLYDGKLGAVVSYNPFSRVAHRVQEIAVNVPDPTLIADGTYQIAFEGQGGIQQAKLGLGYRPNRSISVGASIDFLFGILGESRVTTFNTAQFVDTRFSTETRLAGATGTLGVLGSIPRFLGGDGGLSIGASLRLPANLNGVRTQILGEGASADTLGAELKGDVELPAHVNVGLSYQLRGNWSIIVDATFQPWSNFSSQLSFPGHSSTGPSLLKDRQRYSMGVEWQPSVNPLATYGRRMAYRLGVYTDSGYFDPIQQTDFNAVGVTGGLSLPTLFPGTRIDINLEAGRRGSTDLNLVKETYYRFYLNVNIGERWFERRKLS